jgi:hypothetical protein
MNRLLSADKPGANDVPGTDLKIRTGILEIALICVSFYAVVDIGLLSSYDGVAFVTLAALLQPNCGACLLVLVVSVHDAPGMATPSLYLAVAGVAAGMVINDLCSWRRVRQPAPRELAALLAMALALSVYGTISSWLNERLAARPQSTDRHFALIALLIAAMPAIAWLAWRQISANRRALPQLRVACAIALAHVVLISVLEFHYGPLFATSSKGAAEIVGAAQLIEAGDRGMFRLTGPFLTPNNLAYVPAVILLLMLATSETPRVSNAFLTVFVLVGGGLAVLGASRSMLLFFIASSALMVWYRSRPLAFAFVVMSAIVSAYGVDPSDARSFTRLDDVRLVGSTRATLWEAVIEDFGWIQWTAGTGLTHWDTLFENVYFEDRVSDPHNWILSVIGMFGLLGMAFYLMLGTFLLRAARNNSQPRCVAALSLLVLYFGRDLLGVQYVLNNHPNTCLNWLLLCLLLGGVDVRNRREELLGNVGLRREFGKTALPRSRAA